MRKLICAFIMLCHTNLLFADCKLIDYVEESIVTNSTLDVTNLTNYLLEQKRMGCYLSYKIEYFLV